MHRLLYLNQFLIRILGQTILRKSKWSKQHPTSSTWISISLQPLCNVSPLSPVFRRSWTKVKASRNQRTRNPSGTEKEGTRGKGSTLRRWILSLGLPLLWPQVYRRVSWLGWHASQGIVNNPPCMRIQSWRGCHCSFPVSVVVPTILEIYQNLLGVQFQEIHGSTWHPGTPIHSIPSNTIVIIKFVSSCRRSTICCVGKECQGWIWFCRILLPWPLPSTCV